MDSLEMSVIGGLLLEDVAVREKVLSQLTAKCFESPVLRRVYRNIRRQQKETGDCDCVGASEGIENPAILKECMDITAVKGVLPYHAARLFDRYRKRVLLANLEELTGDVAFDVPLGDIVHKLQRALEVQLKFDEIRDSSTSLDFTDSIVEYLNSLYAKEDRPIKTGCSYLDFLLGGFRRKSVNVLSGRSGSGKTDLAVFLAVKMAIQGVRVLYLTMEMPRTQIMERIASSITGIDSSVLGDKEQQDTEAYERRYEAVSKALDRICEIPMTFDEQQNLSVTDIETKIRKHRPDVVFIDHLGLMRQNPKLPQWQNAFENSQALKKVAMRENVIVIELVQQNSGVEKRADKKARLADLKGSDGIGNDADTVMFVSAQLPEGIMGGNDAAEAKVEIVKNRHGKTGTAPFRWQPQYHRYIAIDTRRGIV